MITKLINLVLTCTVLLVAQLSCLAQDIDEVPQEETELIYVKNRISASVSGVTALSPLNESFSGSALFSLRYMKELRYDPWLFVGVELAYLPMDVRVDITEEFVDGELFEDTWVATSFMANLSFIARVYPLQERNVNPYMEAGFGPRFLGTALNYTALDYSKDRSHISIAYFIGAGATINLPDLYSIDVGVSYERGSSTSFWMDNDGAPVAFADPFENFTEEISELRMLHFRFALNYNF